MLRINHLKSPTNNNIGTYELAQPPSDLGTCATDQNQKEQRAPCTTNRKKSRVRPAPKINQNVPKPPWIVPKICTDQIHHSKKLFPKNYRLGSIQTPGNRDLSHERKWEKTVKLRQRNQQIKKGIPKNNRRIWASILNSKTSTKLS